MPNPTSARRRILLRLLVLLLVAVGLTAFRAPILRGLAAPLCVEATPERPVDRVLLYSGAARDRLAGLWLREDLAKGVLLVAAPDDRAVVLGVAHPGWWPEAAALMGLGVSRARIEVLDTPVLNVADAAAALGRRLEERPGERIRIVCSELDCGNLRRAVRAALGDRLGQLDWSPLSDPRFTRDDWWTDKHGVLTFFRAWTRRAHGLLFGFRRSSFELWDLDEWVREEAGGRAAPGSAG